LRYDISSFTYKAINIVGEPEETRSFRELSPRLALIYAPSEKYSLRIMAGRAFRAPSPTEMFGANTWTLASNIQQLEPEKVSTTEIVFDYKPNKSLNFRINAFYTKSEGQIAYSLANQNLSTNIYSLTNAGSEIEVLYKSAIISGFWNFSYNHRLDESIYDAEQQYVSEHANKLTWAPACTSNLGISANYKKLTISTVIHLQGKVERRAKDFNTSEELAELGLTSSPRNDEISAWVSADARCAYRINENIEVALSATNIFDTDNYLVKNMKYLFDYKMEGRRVLFNLMFSL